MVQYRRAVPFVRVGATAVPSLALAAAMRVAGTPASGITLDAEGLRFGSQRAPLVEMAVPSFYGGPTRVRRMLIHFTGPVLSGGKPTYPATRSTTSSIRSSSGSRASGPLSTLHCFAAEIVFVGTTAAGLSDVFTVPFALGKMPGAQIHANLVDNLLSGRFMQPLGDAGNLAVVVVSALLLGIASVFLGIWAAVGVAIAVALAVGGGSVLLFDRGLWVEVSRPALAVAFSAFGGTAYRYFPKGREKRQVKQIFSRFVSRDVFDQLIADPTRARLGGARREMTVLFSDIRGFTTFAERGQAQGHRQPAQRVLFGDGGRAVPAPGHGGQVRGRHGDGPVRRAAR